MYYVPARDTSIEEVIEKSRFIACVKKCPGVGEARQYLAELRKANPKARHIAYAWYFGDSTAPQCGSSDDGEPKGTAGRPILEAILAKNARNLVVAVVRYFGGKKLGASGLTRAYHGTAVAGLNACGLKPDIAYCSFEVILDYDRYDAVRKICQEKGWTIQNEQFAEKITVSLLLEAGTRPGFPFGMVLEIRE
ncbi:MAG: YigZ family protein [Spirochaetales bacterium]|nr:YigZ family protein [Spirochaetales bacterium]